MWWRRVPLTVQEKKRHRVYMVLTTVCGLVVVCVGLVKDVLPVTVVGVVDLFMAAGQLQAYLRTPTFPKSN